MGRLTLTVGLLDVNELVAGSVILSEEDGEMGGDGRRGQGFKTVGEKRRTEEREWWLKYTCVVM